MQQLFEALEFAAEKHNDQRRKDAKQSPYIKHPIGVAKILAVEGNVQDVEVLMVALLHDTLEDTETKFEELVIWFGTDIAQRVLEVTDDKKLSKVERKKHQIDRARRGMNPKAALVKMADKLHNMRSLKKEVPIGWSVERAQGYVTWSHAVTQHLRGINSGLDDALDTFYKTARLPSGEPCYNPDVTLEMFYKNFE